MDAIEIIKKFEIYHGRKANWEDHWDDVLTHCLTHKADIWTPRDMSSGEKKNQRVVDGTAIDCVDKLSSHLNSVLTNPATRWFSWSTGDSKLDDLDEVRAWLQECEDITFHTLERTNFYTELHEYYQDMASIGTCCFITSDDEETDLIFHSVPIFDVEVDENSKGYIDTVFRKIRWTAKQLIDEFGESKIPKEVMDEFLANGSKRYEVIHAVYPIRHERDASVKKRFKASGKEFMSKYVLVEFRHELSVGGFNTNRHAVPRWTKMSGEIFGRGPGMKALPDIKMLNAVMHTTIRAAQKVTDPPMQVPDDGTYFPADIRPGGINYYRPGSKDRIETMDIKSRPDFGIEFINRLEIKVKEAFYVNQMMLTREPQMTATEVMQRNEESLRTMGPIYSRQYYEFLVPTMDSVFDILASKGKLPEAPEVLREKGIMRAKYTSAIAKAQKTMEVDMLNRALGSIAPMAQMFPSILDNFNSDGAFDFVFNKFDLPANLKVDKKDRDLRRKKAEEMQREALEMQRNQADADVVSKVGQVAVQDKAIKG